MDIFYFGSPSLYFYAISGLMMLMSFYLAIWFANILTLTIVIMKSPMWMILSILPGLVSFVIYTYIIKCSAMLHALLYLDLDVLEETIEVTESSHILSN